MAKSNKKRSVRAPGNPAAAEERSRARQEAAELARKTKKRQQARRAMIQGAVGVAVVALVIGIVVLVLTTRDSKPEALSGGPAESTSEGAYVMGNPDAPVTVQVIEDFQCPVCKQFEATSGDQLASYIEGDEVKVEYRTISFLDRASTSEYSSRALNASACVMGSGPEVWSSFHELLFENQPEEGGAGLSDGEIAALAGEASADESSVATCIDDKSYGDWVKATTDKAFADGISGTPTVFVDGKKLDDFAGESIQKAVDEALAS